MVDDKLWSLSIFRPSLTWTRIDTKPEIEAKRRLATRTALEFPDRIPSQENHCMAPWRRTMTCNRNLTATDSKASGCSLSTPVYNHNGCLLSRLDAATDTADRWDHFAPCQNRYPGSSPSTGCVAPNPIDRQTTYCIFCFWKILKINVRHFGKSPFVTFPDVEIIHLLYLHSLWKFWNLPFLWISKKNTEPTSLRIKVGAIENVTFEY